MRLHDLHQMSVVCEVLHAALRLDSAVFHNHDAISKMSERLDYADGDTKKIFRDSLVNKPLELCALLTKLNVTKDPQLEEARRMLEIALSRADLDDLRNHADARVELKNDVQNIINKFNW